MKKRILSIILAICLCLSPQSVAYAGQESPLPQEGILAEERTPNLAAREGEADITPAKAYEAMIALKDDERYKEGTPWTNYEPYPNSTGGDYHWKGGTIDGANISAVGCVAFAFILSDEAFGSLPARRYGTGGFKYEDIKVGDILQVNGDAHTVIVLEVSEVGVIVAEGNFNSTVHWGRAISKEEVMGSASHYITRYPEGSIPPDDPTANEPIANGTLEGGLTWSLTKAGTLTVSGNGAMPDFASAEGQPWIENSSKIRKAIIGNGVTNIGSCAFQGCGVLSAEIPTSVATIGNNAFYGSSLISVTIPSSVKTIGDNAFQQCQNLSTVSISEGVETIGQSAFNACTNLTAITLPSSITEVGATAFFQCQELANVTFAPGSKQVTLGDSMFTQCYKLMNVTLPQSINCIGADMFGNCMMLAEIEIPQGAESIGERAFASCSGLAAVVIPHSVTSIGIGAFSNCPLSDIHFTGTEAQWNSIRKLGDTATALSNVNKNYSHTPAKISEAAVTLDSNSYTYDGTAKEPSVTVELNGKTLVLNKDYIVTYSNNTEAGTATVTVTGKFMYTGSKTANFFITQTNDTEDGEDGTGKIDISKATVTLSQTSYIYDEKPKTPSVTVTLDSKTLVLNTDYTVTYTNNKNVGMAAATVTGIGKYTGSKTVNFSITQTGGSQEKIDISKATITLSQTIYTYDGTPKTPSVTVTLDGKTLALNTDYTVAYTNNKNVGTATVTITGKGAYTNSKTAGFTIQAASQNTTNSITCKKTVYKVAYGTKPFKINATSNRKLSFTSSKPKIAAVDKNTGKVTIKNTGIATITIKAGTATKKVTIKVSPKKQSVKSVKSVKGKKLTVKWAKDKMASGYQVQISTDKKFKKNVKSKNLPKVSYTFTKLKTGKKYYARVRSYKKSGKETLYGTWSKVKSGSKIKK